MVRAEARASALRGCVRRSQAANPNRSHVSAFASAALHLYKSSKVFVGDIAQLTGGGGRSCLGHVVFRRDGMVVWSV